MEIGQHRIIDLYDCVNADKSQEVITKFFFNALKKSNFTVISEHCHEFEPQGLSGVYVLAESHFTFHIWVEYNFVSIDVYWCGKSCDDDNLISLILDFFKPKRMESHFIKRGIGLSI